MLKKTAQPEIVVSAAAAIWGLFWVPLRAFENRGLDPAWVVSLQFIAPLAFMLPFAILRLRHRLPTGMGQYSTALLVGGGIVMYCQSLLLTDVVRSLILFYAMPAWGTLLEVGLMGRRFTLWRGQALVLSQAGLFTITGLTWNLALSMNTGDVLALLSGIVFTFGAMRIRRDSKTSVFEQVFAFFFQLNRGPGLFLAPSDRLGAASGCG